MYDEDKSYTRVHIGSFRVSDDGGILTELDEPYHNANTFATRIQVLNARKNEIRLQLQQTKMNNL